ncbi:MAG: hypothetical protein M3Q08_13090 [Pseudomonadota bacterium]|nr:hypothetical protein [Pseudomonadota bacterium]
MLDRNDDIGVLFTDISMPGEMDGIRLAEKARAARPNIGLLLTSGRGEPSEGEIRSADAFFRNRTPPML